MEQGLILLIAVSVAPIIVIALRAIRSADR
jgi:hypothetical protein